MARQLEMFEYFYWFSMGIALSVIFHEVLRKKKK